MRSLASFRMLSGNGGLLQRRTLMITSRGTMLRTSSLFPSSLSLEDRRRNTREVAPRNALLKLLSHDQQRRLLSSPGAVPPTSADQETPAAPVKMGRFRELWHNYGMVFLGSYGALYLVTLGTVYEIVAMKHIDAVSAVSFLHSLGVDKIVDLTPIATSKAGNFALAWILTKFTEPIRLAVTVTFTPSLARFLGRAPPKPIKVAKDISQPSTAANTTTASGDTSAPSQ